MKSSLLSVLPIVFVLVLISARCSSDDQGVAPVAVATGTAPTATPVAVNTLTLTSTTSAPDPTQAPTATPVPTEKPLSSGIRSRNPAPTRGPTESFTIHDLELEPKVGTVFETLLSKLPDNEATREYTRLGDVAGVVDALGVVPLPSGSSTEEATRFFEDLINIDFTTGFFVPIFEWPAELSDWVGSIDTYPDLAFDWMSVDQFAHSNNYSFRGDDPLSVYDVALGSFDPAETSAALAQCDCDQPEIREHEGTEYFAWGEGDGKADLQRRLDRPFYDHMGRGPHLLVREGEAYYSVRDGAIDDHIDVIQGTRTSLAEAEDYVTAVQWIASMGIVSDINLRSRGFTVDEVVAGGRGGLTETEIIQDTPLLAPFTIAATGAGNDRERTFVGLVIVHDDAVSAETNLERLLTRIRNVTGAGIGSNLAGEWSFQIDRIDVQTSGRFLIARIYLNHPGYGTLLNGPNTLLVHE